MGPPIQFTAQAGNPIAGKPSLAGLHGECVGALEPMCEPHVCRDATMGQLKKLLKTVAKF
jgi:hypothetical protein